MTARIYPGLEVVITSGDAAGRRGRVDERAKVTFGGIPVWAVWTVSIGGLPILRSIREDFLAPAPPAEVAS